MSRRASQLGAISKGRLAGALKCLISAYSLRGVICKLRLSGHIPALPYETPVALGAQAFSGSTEKYGLLVSTHLRRLALLMRNLQAIK